MTPPTRPHHNLPAAQLLPWLLARLRPRAMDGNKQYASEILAILAQQSDANKRRMGEGEGIDIVLQAIAPYRNRWVGGQAGRWVGG